MKPQIAKIYLRSLTGILTTGVVIAYLSLTDPVIIGGWFAGITAWILLETRHSEN